ncbi:MAG: N-acetyltransferase, partial [Bacteroidales bacterium]
MSYITISEVVTKDDLWNFIRFPKTLYKRCPHYVPSLESEDYATLTSHPAKEFCSIRMWLAYKNGKMVGRIAGIINHKCNEIKKQKRIRFGWFDVINDWEVATSLMETVENWGKREQLLEISGPSRFSNMEKQAMLIEGFDKTPPISAEY